MFKRIVSLAPSISETICTLGKSDLLVGVTDFCNYPDECLPIAKIGGFASPDIDKILALKPDIIIASSLHQDEKLRIFEENGITIKKIKATLITDSPNTILQLGKLLDISDKAIKLASQLEFEINNIFNQGAQITKKPKVCYLCTSVPFCNYKSKCQTNGLIEQLGGELISYSKDNIAKSIIDGGTEVIIIPYKKDSADFKKQQAFIENNPELSQSKAFINNKIVNLNGELLSRPGPRAAQGLQQLFNLIHK